MNQDQKFSNFQPIRQICCICENEAQYYHLNYAQHYCWRHWPEEGMKILGKARIPKGEPMNQCLFANCKRKLTERRIVVLYCSKHLKELVK